MKTAIVLGATGLIGSHLVKQLSECDAILKVIAVTRRPVEYSSDKIENQVINFENLSEYANIFKGDLLFSALGTTAKKAGSKEKHRKIDHDYQLEVASIAVKNGVQHYLLVSSAGANSKSPYNYSRIKGELDEKVVTLGFLRVSIFRPSLLLGERKESRFLEGVGAYLLPVLGLIPGLRKYRPIQGLEVAKKMIQVSHSDIVHDKTIEYFTYDENFLT